MEYETQKQQGRSFTLTEFIRDHKRNILEIVSLNALMLLFGFLGEIGTLPTKISVPVGSVFFLASFYLVYTRYAQYTENGKKLFYFLGGVWSLYAVAACLNLHYKNTLYYLLDIVAKYFYGLFIYAYIRNVGVRS